MGKAHEYVPQGIRHQVMVASKGKCAHCGKKATRAIVNPRGCLQFFDQDNKSFHLDHVIPLAKGGKSEVSNLVTSCPKCNLSGRTKIAENDTNVQEILKAVNKPLKVAPK